jgi:pimeloyl-ACP methyl ester carboxylesterase
MTLLPAALEILADGRRVRVARLNPLAAGAPLVLLHGYPDNLQIFSRLAPLLAARHAVIAVDWPGMGDSPAWPGGTTPEHQAGRLRDLLDQWGIARAGLVAMDMGAQPALVLAARHPDRVAHLTVMNALVMHAGATSWDLRILRTYGWNRWLLRHVPGAVFRRAAATSLPRGGRLPDDVRGDLWRCFARPEVRAFIIRLCAGYQATLPRLVDDYRRIAVPTRIVWGGRDRHFPSRQGEALHRVIAGSEFTVLPHGTHWMAHAAAEDVAAAILGRVPGTSV